MDSSYSIEFESMEKVGEQPKRSKTQTGVRSDPVDPTATAPPPPPYHHTMVPTVPQLTYTEQEGRAYIIRQLMRMKQSILKKTKNVTRRTKLLKFQLVCVYLFVVVVSVFQTTDNGVKINLSPDVLDNYSFVCAMYYNYK